LWIALGTRWWAARLLLLALSGAAVGFFLSWVEPPGDASLFVVFPACYAIWLGGSLFPFRLLGFRLIWRQRARL
jgi:hypothetical protein